MMIMSRKNIGPGYSNQNIVTVAFEAYLAPKQQVVKSSHMIM